MPEFQLDVEDFTEEPEESGWRAIYVNQQGWQLTGKDADGDYVSMWLKPIDMFSLMEALAHAVNHVAQEAKEDA